MERVAQYKDKGLSIAKHSSFVNLVTNLVTQLETSGGYVASISSVLGLTID